MGSKNREKKRIIKCNIGITGSLRDQIIELLYMIMEKTLGEKQVIEWISSKRWSQAVVVRVQAGYSNSMFSQSCNSYVIVFIGAIVFILALVILGILAPITLTSMLTSSAQRMPPDSTDLSPYSIRHPKFWPKTDKNHFNNLDGIPMPFLFPPNVSTCSGFGFTCTGAVKMIIPSSKRCDGIKDYQDGFDERIARNVNQYFHAVLTSKKIRRRSARPKSSQH
ncbi:hypothetical protein CRE_25736 [Caenorhabditis remanei]|uniref:Uncharacterized protein n=1 Tax=Caenorhabditis remanei TaxID=31234 RepID=E3MLC8_CAERE|nr:hypothetical protein CRE_25736 [Caenorhabditis remanei]